MLQLTGKTALVTGGSRGIGAAIVRHLAKEGANVAFTYSSSGEAAQKLVAEVDALKNTSGQASPAAGATLALRVDSLDPIAVQEAVSRAFAHFGKLDILVNNAGIFELKPTGEF